MTDDRGSEPGADAAVLDGITPENIISPPACTAWEYIRDNPADAIEATISGIFDGIAEMARLMEIWGSLSEISRRALENAHDGVKARIASATHACLTRRDLIGPNGAITLLGRQVVDEARTSDRHGRRVRCRMRAKYPAPEYGQPPGCCTADAIAERHGWVQCECDCHRPQRVTTRATS